MMIQATDYIRTARGLIAHPKRWIKGTYASDELGLGVAPTDASATCWCSTGALYAAHGMLNNNPATYSSNSYIQAYRLLNEIAKERGFQSIVDMNDSSGVSHSEIMNVFNEAERRVNANC